MEPDINYCLKGQSDLLYSGARARELEKQPKSARTRLVIVCATSVLCIALAAMCLILHFNNRELVEENTRLTNHQETLRKGIYSLREQLDEANRDYYDLSEEIEFWRDYAVITTTTGSKYHAYGCPHIEGREFYIYNIDNAIYKGYSPCLDCIE